MDPDPGGPKTCGSGSGFVRIRSTDQWLIIICFQEENPPAESEEAPSTTADGQTEGSSEAESAPQIEEGPAEAGGQRMDTLDDNKPPGDD
jgi:hypothetical protein